MLSPKVSETAFEGCDYKKTRLRKLPTMPSKKDFTQVAHSVFQQAIGEVEKPLPLTGRKANSSKGGKVGGAKRAEVLTKEQLTEQAKKAAGARWLTPRKNHANKRPLNEAITIDLLKKQFTEQGYDDDDTIVIEREQATGSARINKLLANASKRGNGKGYPDFIVTHKKLPDFVFIVECKADVMKHQSATLDSYADYAVDGARLYADYLSREMDVLYLGVSGQNATELKVSHFLQLKDEREHHEIFKDCGLQDFSSYVEQLKNYRFRVDYEDLLKYVSGLNEQLHAKKIPEKERALLFSGILIALEDEDFKEGYKTRTDAKRLAKYLVESIIAKLESSNVPQERQAGLKAVFTAIQSHTGLIAEGYLLELVREVDTRIRTFIKGNEYTDIISRCYVEFLKYANDDGSLGIVLTPQHIAGLFCDIAHLDTESVVLDNCCGTGGFLVAAMNKMVGAAKGSKKVIERIKAKQVLGVEYQNHIFNLCVSNMIIHGDGKSNIWNGDCFDLIDQLKPFSPSVALLNPPYNDVSGIDELVFIENALSVLEKNGMAVAIVPMRCALYEKGAGAILKERILKNHTLDSVMSMPDELFYPKGVITCVMVFKAHVPHDVSGRYKTWFGYWKDDGHAKVKHRGRLDTKGRWDNIRQRWLEQYQNREVTTGESVTKAIKASDEWCAEAYIKTDFSMVTIESFRSVVRSYLASCISIGDLLSYEEIAQTKKETIAYPHQGKEFKLEDIFELKKGKRLTKADMSQGATPYLGASALNNGVTMWIDSKPIHTGGTISVNYDGSVGEAFYQKYPFWASDAVNVLYPKFDITPAIGLFLCAIIRAEKYRYNFGRKWHLERMRESVIRLPAIENGTPDWGFMERYIKALPFSSNSV